MLSTGGSTYGYFGAKFAVSLLLPRLHPACHLASRPSLCRSRLPINRTYFSRCVTDPTAYLFFCSRRLTGHSRHPLCRCYWSSDDTDLPDILFQCGSGPSPLPFPTLLAALTLATDHALGGRHALRAHNPTPINRTYLGLVIMMPTLSTNDS